MGISANSNISSSETIQIIDILTPGNPVILNRVVQALVTQATNILMAECLVVPVSPGVVLSLGNFYGLIFIHNLSQQQTLEITFTVPGPSTQNWGLGPGGVFLYNNGSTPGATGQAQALTSVTFVPQANPGAPFPIEYIFAQTNP